MLEQIKATVAQAVNAVLPKKTPAAAPVSFVKKTAPLADEIQTEALLAWKSPTVNTKLLVAYRPGTDPNNPNNLLTVHVRSNVNFLPHMKFNGRQVSESVYELVGPLPRWRGRW